MDEKHDDTESIVLKIRQVNILSKEIHEKISILKEIRAQCINKSRDFRNRYKCTKSWDEVLEFLTATLSGISIALIVAGFDDPVCLLVSAIASATEFVLSRAQNQYNFKEKYGQLNTSLRQYNDLVREISTVLSKNHMSSSDYQDYIEEVNAKLSLIEDSEIL